MPTRDGLTPNNKTVAGKPNESAPPFTPTPKTTKTGGYVSPVPNLIKVGRTDQGQDYQGKVGSNVVAIGNARIDYVGPATGFGQMIIYTLTSGKWAGTRIYVGHAQPLASLKVGDTINQGAPVATLLQNSLGNAKGIPGWTEVGIADDNALRPKYQGTGGGGGVAFKQVLGHALTPSEKTQVKAAQAAADAASSGLALSRAQVTANLDLAKQELHVQDPWVTIIKTKNGQTMFGQSAGVNPPKNVLTYGGQPLTKNTLSSVWGQTYAGIYEAYTGRTPTANDIITTLSKGLSPYGLRASLAGYGKSPLQSFKDFQKSPAYKQKAEGINAYAQSILGTDAPKSILQQAIAEDWDSNTLQQTLRKQPGYTNGPEFTNNYADFKKSYQSIYGVPDEANAQNIKEAAASGWTKDAWESYLRSQPQYTSSIEYQSNAVSFLDNMGLLFKQMPVLKVNPSPPAGGSLVPNSPLVPGAPHTLTPQLSLASGLAPVGEGQ